MPGRLEAGRPAGDRGHRTARHPGSRAGVEDSEGGAPKVDAEDVERAAPPRQRRVRGIKVGGTLYALLHRERGGAPALAAPA